MKVELVTSTKGEGKYEDLDAEEIISAIARHGIIKEDNGKLIKYLMVNSHWSPLDMVDFGFEIETSRAIGRQILRHSTLKPQEHSQRYSDKISFQPIEIRLEDDVNRQSSKEVVGTVNVREFSFGTDINDEYLDEYTDILDELALYLKTGEKLYKKMLRKNIAKECARNILPECTTSVLTFKGSIRSWLSFLNVRCDHHAQKEVREIAEMIGEQLEIKMPNVFKTIDWRKGMFM